MLALGNAAEYFNTVGRGAAQPHLAQSGLALRIQHVDAGHLATADDGSCRQEELFSLALTCLGACRYDLDGTGGLDVFFLTRDWAGEPTPLEKTSEVGWFDPDELPGDALPWLPGVLDAHLRGGVRLSEMLDGWAALRGVPLADR